MKKALVLLALSLTMLPSLAANQRLWITGYRIGDSEIMVNDDHRIVASNNNNEVKFDVIAVTDNRLLQKAYLGVSVPAGQKVLRWMAYDSNPIDTIPEQSNQFADAVTQHVWSYNSSDTADKYIVVDFDYIKYNLSYQANGGSGELPSSKNGIVYTDSVEISTNELVRKGYTWSGWTNNLTTTVWTGGETVAGSDLGVNWHADGSNVVLRAKWTPNKYTINFDKNTTDDVDGEMSPMTNLTYDVSTNLTSNAFGRAGYRFSGWATKKDADDASYEDGASVSNLMTKADGTLILYAVWSAKKFSIKYHRNYGDDETSSQGGLSYDKLTKIAAATPRKGYTFIGWATSQDGMVADYKSGEEYSIDPGDADVIHLYAVWTPIEYTIKFDANGGEGKMNDAIVKYDDVYVIPKCDFTKPNLKFEGWATNIANGVEFSAGVSVSNLTTIAGGIVTFYAVWPEPRYVAFNGNDADNPGVMVEDVMAFVGVETKTLVPNKFEKTGYTFAGWATNKTAIVVYTNCADVVSTDLWEAIGETNFFYAVWTANVYTVSFNPNGGTVSPTSKSVIYDSAYGDLPTPTLAGNKFDGWYTAASGGLEVSATNVVETAKNHIVYAHWNANTYTVTFNKQGGTGGDSSVTATYGTEMPPATMPTRDGYTFIGYYSDTNGGRTKYYDADGSSTRKWIKDGNGELFAYWTANTYEVTFDANGGTALPPTNVTYTEAYGELPTPTRTGYTFDGWYTAASGGSKETLTNVVTILGDHTLYAHWSTNKYTVTFDANGGTVAPTSKSVIYDAKYGDLPEPTLTGYKCDGWYTADGAKVTAADVVTNADDHVLYAHWTAKECKVIFDANGGSDSPITNVITYAEAYGELPTPTRTGYKFDGWYTAASGGTLVTATTIVTTPDGHTLYAAWVELRYIEFDGYGAENVGAMAEDTMTFEGMVTKTLAPNKFEKTGYTFAGWATNEVSAALLDIAYTNCAEIVSANLWKAIGETNVFYAVWHTNKYTVVFNANGGGTGPLYEQEFIYDQGKALLPRGFASNLEFNGWATNRVESEVFGPSETVINLTAEADGIVMLYAVWDNSDLSKAMHCANLKWETENPESAHSWKVAKGPAEGYNPSGSSVSNCLIMGVTKESTILSPHSVLSAESSGMLSFWYRTSDIENCWLTLAADGQFAEPIEIEPSLGWVQFGPTHISNISSVQIVFHRDKGAGSTIWIDQMTWVPVGSEPTGDPERINIIQQNDVVNGEKMNYARYDAAQMDVDSAEGLYVNRGIAGPRVYCTAEAEPIEGVVFDRWELTVGEESNVVSYVTNSNPLILDGKYSCFTNPAESNCYVRATFKWLEYSIDYNANGDHGTVTPDSGIYIYTNSVPLLPTVTPSPGYSLAGWATNAAGEVVFMPGQSVTGAKIGAITGGGVTLYANWTQNVYSVTFCYTNSEGIAASTVCSVPGTEDAVPPDSAVYDSWPCHKFIGWDVDFSNVVSNVTVNAQYLNYSYIAFDGNGADNPDAMLGDVVTFEGEETKALVPNKFEKAGYTFAGWATNDVVVYADCAVADSTNLWAATGETNTLYAVWDANAYTVVFEGNGGTSQDTSASSVTNAVVYGEEVNMPVFTRTGYVLDGWTCGSTTNATDAVLSNLTTTAYAIVKMTAKWIALVEKPESGDSFVYDGLAKVGIAEQDGYSLDGNIATNVGSHTVTVTLEDGYVWSDGTTGAQTVEWSIAKATYDMSCVIFKDKTFVADGTPKSLAVVTNTLPDGVSVSYDGNGQTEPGDHKVTATFTGDAKNYEPIPSMTATLTIVAQPIRIDVPTAVTGLVYNGSAQIGVVKSAGYTLAGNIATNAGSYSATATLEEGYVWADGTTDEQTIQWSIAKATYDMSGVSFADKTVEADGTAKSIEISGTLPSGVTVSYAGNGQTEPGTNTVTATFTGDTANYNSIPDKQATLTITKKPEPTPPDPGPGPTPDPDPDPDPEPDPEPEKTPDLYPSGVEALGAFTAEKSATYNGWLKDDDERIVALLTVKTTAAKSGKQTKSTITVTPVNGKKYTKKTSFYPGGNPADEFGIVYGARGLLGTFGGYSVEAGVDVYKSKYPEMKALAAKIPVATYTFSVDTGNGMAVFSVVVAKTGKVKVQGYLEDGAKISVSTSGALGENYFAVPVVSSKVATRCGFVLWFPLGGGSQTLANFYDSNWNASLSGGSYALSDGEHVFDFDAPEYQAYLASVDGFDVAPTGAVFTVKRGKWNAGKTVGRLKVVNGVPTVTGTSSPSNLSALKLTYTAKSGLVKGSFKLYYMDGKRLKNDTVTVTGVVVEGKLFGSGTIKKRGSFAVWAE